MPTTRMPDAAMEALVRRYTEWARARGLEAEPSVSPRFVGRLIACDVEFATGLGGSAPNPPELVVTTELGVEEPLLLRRREADAEVRAAGGAREALLLRELLAVSDQIRNVGLTRRFVRITFEPESGEEVFDAALEALEERLRLLQGEGEAPYRG